MAVHFTVRFETVAGGKVIWNAAQYLLPRPHETGVFSMIFVETTGVVVKTAAGIKDAAGLAGRKSPLSPARPMNRR